MRGIMADAKAYTGAERDRGRRRRRGIWIEILADARTYTGTGRNRDRRRRKRRGTEADAKDYTRTETDRGSRMRRRRKRRGIIVDAKTYTLRERETEADEEEERNYSSRKTYSVSLFKTQQVSLRTALSRTKRQRIDSATALDHRLVRRVSLFLGCRSACARDQGAFRD